MRLVVAVPADADHVEDWVDWNNTGEFERYMRGTRRSVAGVEIRIAGWQDGRGAVARRASVWATDTHLDAAALCPGSASGRPRCASRAAATPPLGIYP